MKFLGKGRNYCGELTGFFPVIDKGKIEDYNAKGLSYLVKTS